MKKIQVCAAVIRRNGKTLVCTRPKAATLKDRVEFPGGKVEPGESIYECVVRELREELDAEILPLDVIADIDWDYPGKRLNLVFIRCILRNGCPLIPQDGQTFFWEETSMLDRIDFLPADLSLAKLMAQAAAK